MKKFLSFFLIVFISCSQQSITNSDIHIVPILKKSEPKSKPNEPPPPPPVPTYYLPSNFIIDSSGAVYFYQQQLPSFICGTGIYWDTPASFIDLKPTEIVQVPLNSIDEFIRVNILTLDVKNRLVAIASLKDTAKSAGLTKIMAVLSNNSNKTFWLFRIATQEERIVLQYKKQNWRYYFEDIKWDSTKIRFRPKYEYVIKLVPPKIEVE